MRKLKLKIDELRVETFATETAKARAGTVWANMPFVVPATDDPGEDGGGDSGYQTCPCTLKHSCNGSCDVCTVSDCPTCATQCC